MRSLKGLRLVAVASLALLISACTCRPHKPLEGTAMNPSRSGDSSIPFGNSESPLADINFAFDSYALTPRAKEILRSNAMMIKEKNFRVEVEGHCDERGTNEYNMVLGAKRSRSAMEYLTALGVAPSSLSTVSYGEELPLDPRHNEEAWAKNRRDHFKVVQ